LSDALRRKRIAVLFIEEANRLTKEFIDILGRE